MQEKSELRQHSYNNSARQRFLLNKLPDKKAAVL